MTRPRGTEPHLVSPRPGSRGGDWVAAGSCENVMEGSGCPLSLIREVRLGGTSARCVVLWGDPRRVSRGFDESDGHERCHGLRIREGSSENGLDGPWGAGAVPRRLCARRVGIAVSVSVWSTCRDASTSLIASRADRPVCPSSKRRIATRQGWYHEGGGPEDTSATIEPTPEISTGS